MVLIRPCRFLSGYKKSLLITEGDVPSQMSPRSVEQACPPTFAQLDCQSNTEYC